MGRRIELGGGALEDVATFGLAPFGVANSASVSLRIGIIGRSSVARVGGLLSGLSNSSAADRFLATTEENGLILDGSGKGIGRFRRCWERGDIWG